MDLFEPVRLNAAELHAELVRAGVDPRQPLDMASAAAKHLELNLVWLPVDDPVLKGAEAIYDLQTGTICCANIADTTLHACLAAHEIGHVRIHSASVECTAEDIDPSRSTEAAPIGLQRVEDYGVKERRELQADVFAREFLLPRSWARELYFSGQGAGAIAKALGLPKNLVRQQLFDALLLPPVPAESEQTARPPRTPDPSQQRAIDHRDSPFLLQAGPGTGKTSTLVDRVVSLIKDQVDPSSILVLTFSNRAAGELSERLLSVVPEAAPKIWMGTFHAFGLDLIRRYHDKLNLNPDPPLFDRSDGIEVLEEILPTLPLVHYRNLWDPAMELREIVGAISRAKDELVDAKQYRTLAETMLATATDEKASELAEKALEVAAIYKLYEDALISRKAVDFGDLIMKPTLLMEADEAVTATLRLRHRHILVDEYQDVNRASARFLKALSGDGKRLWVVGDARQSIYRFRGASSQNMVRFSEDYPGAKIDRLEINYRSSQEIVDAFVSIAPRMGASRGMLALDLEAKSGKSGITPEYRSLETLDDEIAGLAASVRDLENRGARLKDQAILCRTNARLNDIAAGLEIRGIAVLHLGSLFERDEIRDLLSILALAVDSYGDGLARVGAMARYGIPLQDVYAITRHFRTIEGPAVAKLKDAAQIAGLSPAGKQGVETLARELDGIAPSATPWDFLSTYLLDRSDVLAKAGQGDNVRDRMRGVAIWQFMNFARDQSLFGKGAPITRLLDRIRNLVLLAEERDLRQIPPGALHMNAVRLMTVHGSKGLEFDAVHLPGLIVGSFPSSARGQRCPPPTGLMEGVGNLTGTEAAKEAHGQEEECLFFVALSRAKKYLRLYSTRKQPNGNKRNPSEFLSWLNSSPLQSVATPSVMPLPADAPRVEPIQIAWPASWMITQSRLTSYEKCPRRFFYTHVLELGGARKTTAFSRTHDCIYEFIDWLAQERLKPNFDAQAAAAEFERVWLSRGPVDHAFAADYRHLAGKIVDTLVRHGENRQFRASEELPITLSTGRVVVIPDDIYVRADGTVTVRHVRTGYKRSDEYDRLEYTLYILAAQAKYGRAASVEALHLSDESAERVQVTQAKIDTRKAKSTTMLGAIAAGQFPPDPDPVSCPRCPHFFICAATAPGPLKRQ